MLDDLEQFWEENDPEYRKLKNGGTGERRNGSGDGFGNRADISPHMMDAKSAAEAFRKGGAKG